MAFAWNCTAGPKQCQRFLSRPAWDGDQVEQSNRERTGWHVRQGEMVFVVENSKKYFAIVYQDSMIIQRLTWAARDRDRTVTQAPSNQTGRQQQQQRHHQGETEALILTPGDSPIPFPLLPFPKMILSDKFIFCVQFQDRLIATASSRDWCAKLHFLDNHQPSGLVTHQDPSHNDLVSSRYIAKC